MASRAGHYEVAEFLLQNTAPVDAKAKVVTHTIQNPLKIPQCRQKLDCLKSIFM